MDSTNSIKIGFMNIKGQTGLSRAKQHQIESFLVKHKLDVFRKHILMRNPFHPVVLSVVLII